MIEYFLILLTLLRISPTQYRFSNFFLGQQTHCLAFLFLKNADIDASLLFFVHFTVNQTADKAYYYFDGYAHFASGLACGLASLAAGMAIGIVGDAGVRANAQQPKLFVGMILILIFAEALALYGLIGKFVFRCLDVELRVQARKV